ncbi:MAG: hypothetical protein JWN34_3231 [Bryobacterales bacterium]|nr:hypothetical protein [Bryobacterales bacterium]
MAVSLAFGATLDTAYVRDLQQWRAVREEKLKAPTSWLAVAGLFWLHEGENKVGSDPLSDVVLPASAPKHAGVLVRHGEKAQWKPVSGAVLLLDEKSPPATLGTITMTPIVRGPKVGIRLKDPDADTRKHFTGLKWYPAAPQFHLQAKWVPYDSGHTIPITNVLGMTTQEPAPGYAEFTIAGKQYKLEPVTEEDHLMFIFKDETSTSTTYGAGRFLYAPMPVRGVVDLDFNKAENPPCAFTAFATCPLPPKQNMLKVSISAGELRYGKH